MRGAVITLALFASARLLVDGLFLYRLSSRAGPLGFGDPLWPFAGIKADALSSIQFSLLCAEGALWIATLIALATFWRFIWLPVVLATVTMTLFALTYGFIPLASLELVPLGALAWLVDRERKQGNSTQSTP